MPFLRSFWNRYFRQNKTILFGPGMVGKATAEVFGITNIVDKKRGNFDFSNCPLVISFAEEIWICVPTPSNEKGTCDTSEVEKIIEYCSMINTHALYIIRSTVTPGTADALMKKYGVDIISFPEFLSEATALEDTKNPWFCVVGGNLASTALTEFLDKYRWYFKGKLLFPWDNVTAELAKYSVNTLFATLVVFGNQIYDVAEKVGADYFIIRNMLAHLPWKEQHHFNVYHKGYRGYGGRCLPKDTLALATEFNVDLLKNVHRINKHIQRDNPSVQPGKDTPKVVKVRVKHRLSSGKNRNNRSR